MDNIGAEPINKKRDTKTLSLFFGKYHVVCINISRKLFAQIFSI
jgi:hypothetical protein